jgi:broad specificity phosphatase PhoE
VTSDGPVTVSFYRHGEVASHRGDVPLTDRGMRDAEAAGARLAEMLEPESEVALRYAPTRRTLQTLEALRRGAHRALGPGSSVRFGEPQVEPAIRNPDLYVAGTRVEMVSSVDALAAQLPEGALKPDEVASNRFFARFWAEPDRIGFWLHDDDPPGERSPDVARRLFMFARSLTDGAATAARRYVLVTHSGPIRALLREFVLSEDPGEPEYAEAVHVTIDADGTASWRFRDVQAVTSAVQAPVALKRT